ncbi:MAG TPA: NAD(P)H-binding protein [Gammaproteobacteria bacterium]
MQQLVITGASGQLARRVAELVLESCPAERLVLVTRTPDALAHFARRGVGVRFGDFAQPESLPAAFAGGTRMLLVSATDLERRTEQHAAAIAAAAQAGVAHVIYTSGLSPAPPNPAAVAPSHYATEQRLQASGLRWTILRNSLYAEFQAVEARRAAESGVLVHNRGEGRVAYVSREDCAAAAAAVLLGEGHEGAIYDITGPEAFGAAELAALYEELTGKTIEVVDLDDGAFVERLVGDAADDDHLKYGAELVASFGRSIREGFMASCTDAVARLAGRPARTLRETLAAALR